MTDSKLGNFAKYAKAKQPTSASSASDEIKKRFAESQHDANSVILMVNQISPDKDQPRKLFTEVEEKAASIKDVGLLQPIVVRRDPDNDNRYIIIVGETRWRAYTEILMPLDPVKYSTIRASIRTTEKNDPGEILLLQLIENIQKTDLNPLEEADAYKRLKEARGINNKQLAALVHKSESRISRILKLLNLSEEDQQRIHNGELSARDVQRGKGTEAAKKSTIKHSDKTKARIAKLSITTETASALAELLQFLAAANDLPGVEIDKGSKKELIAILENRSSDILSAIK
ncbi:MAG: ParB/RepB/Spo0J family partition protein [Planctomycetes bacterium]|nr:ParB/RepB/Spo0J family partition protein [Planctomycetota bacterium]